MVVYVRIAMKYDLVVVQKDGSLAPYDKEIIFKKIYNKIKDVNVSWQLVKNVEASIDNRFEEFYPTYQNIQDIIKNTITYYRSEKEQHGQ